MRNFQPSDSMRLALVGLFCGLGCISCFYLQKCLMMPSYVASAGVGFVGSFLPDSNFYDRKQLIAGIYTGSFAAMCSRSVFSSSMDITLLSLVVAGYFLVLSPYFKGFGGKLGSIGFISSLSFLMIQRFL